MTIDSISRQAIARGQRNLAPIFIFLTIQNIMRRIIENYFKLLGKYGDDDLVRKFESREDQEICKSLISWINDGSHSINDDLFIEQQDTTIETYRKVFRSIFELTDHLGHYKMMIGDDNPQK